MQQLDIHGFFKTIVDVIPSPVLVVDRDVTVQTHNAAAARMLARSPDLLPAERLGALLHCLHSTETAGGCGAAPACRDCVVRNAVDQSFAGEKIVRQRTTMELRDGEAGIQERHLMVTSSFFKYGDQGLALLILEDISELLKAMLPICSHCKKIRHGAEEWHSLERYFLEHHNIQFSHGICPDCLEKYYPEFLPRPGRK